MKNIKYISSLMLAIAILSFASCKSSSDPAPSDLDQQLTSLMNNGTNWVLGTNGVTKDGFDVTAQFAGFVLTIGNKTYGTANGLSPVWEASGTWDFINDNPNQILRDGSTEIGVSISTSTLILTFIADGVPTGGRTESVSGEYQFHLISE